MYHMLQASRHRSPHTCPRHRPLPRPGQAGPLPRLGWTRPAGRYPAAERLANREAVRADGDLFDLAYLPGRPGIAVEIQHRSRLGVPRRDDGVAVKVAA